MTKQLFWLAAWVILVVGIIVFVGSWHSESYIVVKPNASSERVAAP